MHKNYNNRSARLKAVGISNISLSMKGLSDKDNVCVRGYWNKDKLGLTKKVFTLTLQYNPVITYFKGPVLSTLYPKYVVTRVSKN